jgi:hypothetical protein
MIRDDEYATLLTDSRAGQFYKPDPQRSVSKVFGTVLRAHGINDAAPALPFGQEIGSDDLTTLLIVLDCIGWKNFHDGKSLPFFENLWQNGEVHPITAPFFSTTPNALTSLLTGKDSRESGLYEMRMRFETGEVGISLMSSKMDAAGKPVGRDSLLQDRLTKESIYNGPTFATYLKDIPSWVVTPFPDGAYAGQTQAGSMTLGAPNHDQAINMIDTIMRAAEPKHVTWYLDFADYICHYKGPKSNDYQKALVEVNRAVQTALNRVRNRRNVLVMAVSDHGNVQVDKAKIIYLDPHNSSERQGVFDQLAKTDRYPDFVPITSNIGNAVFHSASQESAQHLKEYLQHKLGDQTEVTTVEELLKQGRFGGKGRERFGTDLFRQRIGTNSVVTIMPEDQHVWYQETPEYEFPQLGRHGGGTEQEMMSWFGYAWLDNLDQRAPILTPH